MMLTVYRGCAMEVDLKIQLGTMDDPTLEVFVVSRKAKDLFWGVVSFHVLKMKLDSWKFMMSHNHGLVIR